MPTHTIRLQDRNELAENTMAFHFEKPPGFQFTAGQFLGLTLIDPAETDAKGNRRNFTIASAPYESDVMIATRIRDSAFKRTLKQMPVRSEVKIVGPFGNLTLAGVSGPVVFVTGGIGITPFRSMALQAARDHWPHPIYLFYSNRRPEDAAFLNELQELEKQNPNFKFVPTMTASEKSVQSWHGETGYIDRPMLGKSVSDLSVPVYYIAGPQGMLKAMVAMLKNSGVSEDRIKSEEFPGY